MSVFEMVVAVVLITVIGGIVRAQMKAKEHGTSPGRDARLDKLEQRVRALEDVVGDKSYELKEKLRELEKAG